VISPLPFLAAANAPGEHAPVVFSFALAAFLGVGLMVLAERLKTTAITLLLIAGILVGPEVLGRLLQPFGLPWYVDPAGFGDGLQYIVGLAVALILFEGGLTLDVRGYRKVAREIWGVLTIGVLVTQDLAVVPMMLIVGSFDEGGAIGYDAAIKVGISVFFLVLLIAYLGRRNYAVHTRENYKLDLTLFFADDNRLPATITHRDVEHFIARHHEQGLAAATLGEAAGWALITAWGALPTRLDLPS